MSIAHDTTTSSQSLGSATLTFSHTVSGSNTILIVGVANIKAGESVPTGVTFNSDALTMIDSQRNAGPNLGCSLWYLIAPADGAHDVVVTCAATQIAITAGATSLTGVAQTSPIGATNKTAATSQDPSLALDTTVANSWIVDVIDHGYPSTMAATGTNQTERWEQNPGGNYVSNGSTETTTTTGTYTMSWHNGGAADQYAHIIAEIKEAVASGPANLKTYDTNVKANIKTINTNVIANVKTLDTNA